MAWVLVWDRSPWWGRNRWRWEQALIPLTLLGETEAGMVFAYLSPNVRHGGLVPTQLGAPRCWQEEVRALGSPSHCPGGDGGAGQCWWRLSLVIDLRDLLSFSFSLSLFFFLSPFSPLFPPSYPFLGAFVFEEPGVFFSSVQSLSGTWVLIGWRS